MGLTFDNLVEMAAQQALHVILLDKAIDELVRALGSDAPLDASLMLAASVAHESNGEVAARLRYWARLAKSARMPGAVD